MLEERAQLFTNLTFRGAIYDDLEACIAVLDMQGEIVSVNDRWHQFAETRTCRNRTHGLGARYADVLITSAKGDDRTIALKGIREVVDGTRSFFYHEYPMPGDDDECWFALHASPLVDRPNLLSASHENITARVKHERRRLRALRDTGLLDSLPDSDFDEIVTRASQVFAAPMAMFTLIDARRQWFKSRVGLDITETARAVSFCAHAVSDDQPLVIEDAKRDKRFENNLYVVHEPRVRFYAGVPVHVSTGEPLGNLCIIDRFPRVFSAKDLDTLVELARELESRLQAKLGS